MKAFLKWTMIALALQFGTVTVLAPEVFAQKKKAATKGKKSTKGKPAKAAPAAAPAAEGEEAAAAEGSGGEAASAKEATVSSAGEYKHAYGMAGCGLGTFVFKENNKMQILAATTNGTSGSQTFGITTGTSNCKAGKETATAEQRIFIEANLASLEKEAAQGQGEHLMAFAALLGCDQVDFATHSQANFRQLYGDLSPEVIMERHHNLFQERCERTHF